MNKSNESIKKLDKNENDDKTNEKSSLSSGESEKSSEELDPDSMDKDEYFRMLRKK